MATSKKPNTVDTVTALAQPVVAEMGLQLWDVRFEKEGASWYLRLFIDKEGGVTIDDCENLSRRMDKILDEADPISQSYYFEVSSPGIGRDLVRPWHFERYLGEQIEVKLIRPMQLENGSSLREFVAPLCSCDDQTITVELDGDTAKNVEAFEQVIRCMHDEGIGYGSINHPVDRDPICGYVGVIGEVCPRCGRREGEAVSPERIKELRKLYPGTFTYCGCE